MREKCRIDVIDLGSKQLQPKLGRRVDDEAPVVIANSPANGHARPHPVIPRVVGSTHRAPAAHHRNADAGTGPQQGQCDIRDGRVRHRTVVLWRTDGRKRSPQRGCRSEASQGSAAGPARPRPPPERPTHASCDVCRLAPWDKLSRNSEPLEEKVVKHCRRAVVRPGEPVAKRDRSWSADWSTAWDSSKVRGSSRGEAVQRHEVVPTDRAAAAVTPVAHHFVSWVRSLYPSISNEPP